MREEKFNNIVGKNIKHIRKTRNIDPDKFAYKLGISGRILKQIEEGEQNINDFIDIHCIARIQNEFGKNIVDELFKGVAELYNTAIKLNDSEQAIINNVRLLNTDNERQFIVWLSEVMASGRLKVI